jgi:hypothetical protein
MVNPSFVPGKRSARVHTPCLVPARNAYCLGSLFPRTNPAWLVRRAILSWIREPADSATVYVRNGIASEAHAISMVGGRPSTQNDSTMTREELRSPNPWLSRAALRSSRKIYGLDTAFVLIDGTKKPGHVILVLYDFSNEITDAEKTNLRNFVESIKGVVVLHHAIADY